MKFGVLANQIRVKIIQTKKQWISCARHGVARRPYRRLWPSAPPPRVGHRRSSHAARTPPYPFATPILHSTSPFSFLALAQSQDELEPPPSSAPTNSRHPAPFPRAKVSLTSHRTSAAPPRPRLDRHPAGIEPQTAVAIVVRRRSFAPSVEPLLPDLLRANRATVSSAAPYSSSPTLSPDRKSVV